MQIPTSPVLQCRISGCWLQGETGPQYFWNIFIPEKNSKGVSNPITGNSATQDASRNDRSPSVTPLEFH